MLGHPSMLYSYCTLDIRTLAQQAVSMFIIDIIKRKLCQTVMNGI